MVNTLIYKNCIFYKLQSKQRLKELLHIKRDVYCKSSFINSKINVYLDRNGRIIEAPDEDIKAIQRIILKGLRLIKLPNYVFSGVKYRCCNQINILHDDKNYILHFDLNKFFYNIKRERVYRFFVDKLETSPDVAEILTNFCTIDLELKNYCGIEDMKNYVKYKIIQSNHLIAGSPSSTLLSFLVNEDMFSEINCFAENENLLFSVYVDDLIFSSDKVISEENKNTVLNLIKKYKFNISDKTGFYKENKYKKLF